MSYLRIVFARENEEIVDSQMTWLDAEADKILDQRKKLFHLNEVRTVSWLFTTFLEKDVYCLISTKRSFFLLSEKSSFVWKS